MAAESFQAAYRQTLSAGKLEEKIALARARMRACELCPRKCGVDRQAGETGFCRTGRRAWVASYDAHFGEEAPLVGSGGSGTIFFTHCNLNCNFCQNYDISHEGWGQPVEAQQLSAIMLALQKKRLS